MRRRFIQALLLFAPGGLAQTTDLPPGVLFTSQAVRHIRQSITTVPDYTCLETIDRTQLKQPSRVFQRLDQVRLEVGNVGGKELFSWPGASKFEERPIADFVAGGLIGDGAYNLFADDLFTHGAASMKFHGPEQLQGRATIRIDYAVGSLRSKFTLQTATGIADVGYSGSFWVQPATMDLIRLDIAAESLPPQLQLSGAHMSIEYRTAKIGEREVTLAQSSIIEFMKVSGDVSRNRIDFTHCRQFGGQAKLILNGPETEPELHTAATTRFNLPGKLTIPLRLVTSIDTHTSSVGDAITAQVDADVRDRRRIWLPKGSLVQGRIRRLEHRSGTSEYVLLGLEFSEVEAGRETGDFVAQFQSVDTFEGLALEHKERNQAVTVVHSGGVGNGGTVTTSIHEEFDLELPGVAYLYLTSPPFRVPANLRMVWKTQ